MAASQPLQFDPDRAALIVIDTQRQWVPMIPDRDRLVANMRILIKIAKAFDMPIVVAEHVPWVIGETVPELREELPEGTPVIKKDVYNTWLDARFAAAVEDTGRQQLVFSGIETHVCMGLPTLEAVRRGYEVFVATDCTGAQTLVDRDTAFLRFWQAGVVPTTWNTLIFEGLQRIALERGWPANERSKRVSEIWLKALPHVANQFHYDPSADPAVQGEVLVGANV
jgi:nicotinamidase-related amidase